MSFKNKSAKNIVTK